MEIAYPEPEFPNGVSIYVSQPAVTCTNSSSVISALQYRQLSSKADYNNTFEKNLRSYFNVPVACSVSNGYSALFVILKSLTLLKSIRDEVILPDATMVAVYNSVIDNNLSPILVDNQTHHLNPSVEMIKSKITQKTLAIIVTHTYGVPIPHFESLVSYCFDNNIFLIQDIAEAIGVTYQGKLLGTFGHFASASLYANKLISCGDGGFILSRLSNLGSDLPFLEQTWKSLINHGFSKGFHFNHLIQSGNYRINGLGAAFISNFTEYIDCYIKKRATIDKIYRQNLPLTQFYTLMQKNSGGQSTPWVFALTVHDHKTLIGLRQHLANYGIETRPFFKPIHTQPIFQRSMHLQNSIFQYQTGFYLPTYQDLTQQMQIYITKCLNDYFQPSKQLVFQSFQKKEKKLLDLLTSSQIIQLIQNLTVQVKNQGSSLLNFEGITKKLKQLGQTIESSEKIQIKSKHSFNSEPQNNQKECENKGTKNLGKK